MGRFSGKGKASLLILFSLITCVFLIHVSFAEAGGIGPNQGFDTVTVLAGQEAKVDTTQIAPFGMHTVIFFSVGNMSISSKLTVAKNQNAEGLWYLILFGPGGHDYISLDATTGIVSVDSGKTAMVDVGNWYLGFVTGGALLFSPVSSADPFKYAITVTGAQRAPFH